MINHSVFTFSFPAAAIDTRMFHESTQTDEVHCVLSSSPYLISKNGPMSKSLEHQCARKVLLSE